MMIYKNLKILTIFTFLLSFTLAASVSSDAQAEPKLWIFSWGGDHWENQDFKPYLVEPSTTHDRQWDLKLEDVGPNTYTRWTSDDWKGEDGGETTIAGFFKADIFREQKECGDIPVLVVGPNFYLLSGYDKRRATDLMNDVYAITDTQVGHFQLRDDVTEDIIGYYDNTGLKLH